MRLRRFVVVATLGLLVAVAGSPALAGEDEKTEVKATSSDVEPSDLEPGDPDSAAAAGVTLLSLQATAEQREELEEALKVLSGDRQASAPEAGEGRIRIPAATACKDPPNCGLFEVNVKEEELRRKARESWYVPRTTPLTFGQKVDKAWEGARNTALRPFHQLHDFLTVGEQLKRTKASIR